MPFDTVPTPYGKFLQGEHPWPFPSIAVKDGVPDSNVMRAVRAASKQSCHLLAALPTKIRKLEDRADAFISQFGTVRPRTTEREREFHAANRADIRRLHTDITTLLQSLREERNFWFQAVKDECALSNKDEVVGDLLFAAAGLGVQMRDEIINTKRRLTEATQFLSAHSRAVAAMDEEDVLHSPRGRLQEMGSAELHNDRIGDSDGPSYIVDDERSALHGTLSA